MGQIIDVETNKLANVTDTTEIITGLRQLVQIGFDVFVRVRKLITSIVTGAVSFDYLNQIVNLVKNFLTAVIFVSDVIGEVADSSKGITNQRLLELIQNAIQSLRRFTDSVHAG